MAASKPIRLPDWILLALEKDPAFRLHTMDGLGWIDPYSAEILTAPFGHFDIALKHFSATKPWLTKKPLELKDLLFKRWLHYLTEHLTFIEPLRVFRNGQWLNPYTGQWLSGIQFVNNRITDKTIEDLARALGKCEEAQSGKMLDKHELDELIQTGPNLDVTPVDQQTAAFAKLKTSADFAAVKKQFLKMLGRPPKLPGYQIVLQYEPHSIIPRNFYDFISLDRDRIMIVMGDLAGDGPGAALMVAQAMRTMRRLASMRADLLDFFAHLNDELRVDLVHGCSIGLFAGVLNIPFNSLTCLSVGFHPAILINSARDITLQQIHTQGERLGVSNGQQFRNSLRPISIQLQIGDIVALFTDGVARAFNSRDINSGRLNVMGCFASNQDLLCGKMVGQVLEEAKSRLSGPPTDDLSALALRVKNPNEYNSGVATINAPVARPVGNAQRR